ncbi:MAG TPA: RecX family transcriptional regulator [Patescibacteria group bacterium]
MPQISAIEPQKRKKDRLNIYIDGQFGFGIDVASAKQQKLEVGQNLTGEKLNEIILESQVGKLLDKVYRFLSYRGRSEKEIKNYLKEKIAKESGLKFREISDNTPVLKAVLKKLKKMNLVNDVEFAKNWKDSRTKYDSKSERVVRGELFKKGIDKELIETLFEEEPINELKLAQKALQKRISRFEKLPPKEKKQKIFRYLASKGFNFDTISSVIDTYLKRE